jgi:hypothetical protein
VEHLEHVLRRIRAGITRIWCQLHLRNPYLAFFKTMVSAIKNLNVPLDRAYRVVLGTRMEHVLRRIRGGITSQKRCLWGIRGTFGAIIRDFRNLMVPLDRARAVIPGTRMEHFQRVSRRIRGEIT